MGRDQQANHVEPGMLEDEWWSVFTNDFDDYEVGAPIGFGASSTVYAATFRMPALSDTGNKLFSTTNPSRTRLSANVPPPRTMTDAPSWRDCAIKISSSFPDERRLFKEARMLGLCRHPNVLRILATFTLPPDHRRIAIVTPLIAGGSLAWVLDWRGRLSSTPKAHHFPTLGRKAEEVVEENGQLEEEEIKAVIKQALEGLVYLHGRGFLHRDLKAGNLLIAPDGTVLLADFGVGGDMNEVLAEDESEVSRPAANELRFQPEISRARTTREDEGSLFGKRSSFVGTPSWMAPEVVLRQKYDTKADIWSLGITILELAYGTVPGSQERSNKILARTVTDAPPSLDRQSGRFTKLMKEFVDGCLCKIAEQRPTAAQLSEHIWLRASRKKAFLAESLLGDVPPLELRQEIHRVSTRSSLDSLLTSWDFSASLPSSPVRSYPFPSSAALSPSVASQLHEYFAPLATNGHSRSSSRIPSMPPSPRISMRQWAESGLDISKIPRRRTGSDTGGFRSPSKSALRRAESASIDLRRSPDVTVPLRHLSGSRRSPEVRTDLAQEASTPGPKSTHFEAADHRSPPIKSTARDSHGDETVSEADTSFEALNSAPSERSKLIASPLEDVASSITLEDSALAQNSIDLPADGVIPSRPPDKVYKRSDSSYRTSAIMPPDEEVGWLGRRSSVRKDRKVWGTSLVQKLTGKKHQK